MTTLAVLKARIADDIARSDLTTQIGEAIDDAIAHYQHKRFYFNETRLATFTTTAADSDYTSADDSDIPLFIELDAVMLNDGSHTFELTDVGPVEIEYFLDNSASSGRPYWYAYYEDTFRLYPIPDATYTVRPIGLIKKAAPASDSEADNVWMTKAFELIRCRAKAYLAAHVLMDAELATVMGAAEQQAYASLRQHTAKKQGSGRIVPTQF